MAYMLVARTVTPYRVGWEWLDGDYDKITNLDQSPQFDGGRPDAPMHCGRPIDTTHLVTRLRPKTNRKSFSDFMGMSSGKQCSAAFRDVIESFEPGVHGFHPLIHEWKNGTQRQTHFVIIPHRELLSLHLELSVPKPEKNRLWYVPPEQEKTMRTVLSKEAIGDAHLWNDPQQQGGWHVSDALAAALTEAELTGFRLIHVEEA